MSKKTVCIPEFENANCKKTVNYHLSLQQIVITFFLLFKKKLINFILQHCIGFAIH